MKNLSPTPDTLTYKAGDNLYQLVLLGALFTFTLMLLDKRVRPKKKDWWFM